MRRIRSRADRIWAESAVSHGIGRAARAIISRYSPYSVSGSAGAKRREWFPIRFVAAKPLLSRWHVVSARIQAIIWWIAIARKYVGDSARTRPTEHIVVRSIGNVNRIRWLQCTCCRRTIRLRVQQSRRLHGAVAGIWHCRRRLCREWSRSGQRGGAVTARRIRRRRRRERDWTIGRMVNMLQISRWSDGRRERVICSTKMWLRLGSAVIGIVTVMVTSTMMQIHRLIYRLIDRGHWLEFERIG